MKDISQQNNFYNPMAFVLPHHQTLNKSRKIQKVIFPDPNQLANSLMRRNVLRLKIMRLNQLKNKEKLLRLYLAQTVLQLQNLA